MDERAADYRPPDAVDLLKSAEQVAVYARVQLYCALDHAAWAVELFALQSQRQMCGSKEPAMLQPSMHQSVSLTRKQ